MLDVAHILDDSNDKSKGKESTPSISSKSKENEVFEYLNKVKNLNTNNENNLKFIKYIEKWTKNQRAGLFQCYDHPILSKTNNDTER